MSTGAGWSEMMLRCATATDVDMMPGSRQDPSLFWIFFFIFFTIVGSFFFLNLFVGVVISTFNSEQDKIGGNNLLTEEQKEWIELKLLVLRSTPQIKPKKLPNKYRSFFYKIQGSSAFDKLVLVFILLNSLILTIHWYR